MQLRDMLRRSPRYRKHPELRKFHYLIEADEYKVAYHRLVRLPVCRRCGEEFVFVVFRRGAGGRRRCLACRPLDL